MSYHQIYFTIDIDVHLLAMLWGVAPQVRLLHRHARCRRGFGDEGFDMIIVVKGLSSEEVLDMLGSFHSLWGSALTMRGEKVLDLSLFIEG